jgi:hypothetical protein
LTKRPGKIVLLGLAKRIAGRRIYGDEDDIGIGRVVDDVEHGADHLIGHFMQICIGDGARQFGKGHGILAKRREIKHSVSLLSMSVLKSFLFNDNKNEVLAPERCLFRTTIDSRPSG